MRVIGFVQFDDDEKAVLRRVMEGHEHALVDPPRRGSEGKYLPVEAFRHRIERKYEWFDLGELEELEHLLVRLVQLWDPQTTVASRATTTPGDEQTRERLAAGRRQAIRHAREAIELAREAQSAIRTLAGIPTRSIG